MFARPRCTQMRTVGGWGQGQLPGGRYLIQGECVVSRQDQVEGVKEASGETCLVGQMTCSVGQETCLVYPVTCLACDCEVTYVVCRVTCLACEVTCLVCHMTCLVCHVTGYSQVVCSVEGEPMNRS